MIKEIFTWWNKQTLGTRIWSYLSGIEVGEDDRGNKYYCNKSDTRRWVIYSEYVEATEVNPEWNNWLRFTSKALPLKKECYDWQLGHKSNKTGTSESYSPKSSIFSSKESYKEKIDYEKWSPKE